MYRRSYARSIGHLKYALGFSEMYVSIAIQAQELNLQPNYIAMR